MPSAHHAVSCMQSELSASCHCPPCLPNKEHVSRPGFEHFYWAPSQMPGRTYSPGHLAIQPHTRPSSAAQHNQPNAHTHHEEVGNGYEMGHEGLQDVVLLVNAEAGQPAGAGQVCQVQLRRARESPAVSLS